MRRPILFLSLLAVAVVAAQLYQDAFVAAGNELLARFSAGALFAVLFALAAISSTILPLPVWIYVFTCVALGFEPLTASLVIALGSALGSATSYALGRWFRERGDVAQRVGEGSLRQWQSRSLPYMGAALFLGTVSPVPMDVLYVVSGALNFPAVAFVSLVTTARIIRYVAMGYLFAVAR